MDWARAIEINRDALSAIVAGLFSMLGLTEATSAARVAPGVRRAVLLVLRPLESAVRRLIVIASRGVVVKPVPPRPLPQGLSARTGAARPAFRLFDNRMRFPRRPPVRYTRNPPRVWSFEDYTGGSDVIVFNPPSAGPAAPADDRVDAGRLVRRLIAVKEALAAVPRQARRLVRWQARRARMKNPLFTTPLRPGRPPGHRARPKHPVDAILKECHWLARDVLRTAPS